MTDIDKARTNLLNAAVADAFGPENMTRASREAVLDAAEAYALAHRRAESLPAPTGFPPEEFRHVTYHWLNSAHGPEVWNWASDTETFGDFSGECFYAHQLTDMGFTYAGPCLPNLPV